MHHPPHPTLSPKGRGFRPKIIPDFSPFALTSAAHGFTCQASYAEAHDLLQTVLMIQPKFMAAWNGLGNCLKGMGDPEMALKAYHQALALNNQDPAVYMNLGALMMDVGEFDLAADHLVTALALMPTLAGAKYNLALCMLTKGELQEGWLLLQDRWATDKFRSTLPPYVGRVPYWSGEKDARVLVWGEQGMGERILYFPMLKDLAAYGCKVYREADPRILPMWQRSAPEITFVGDGHKFAEGEITHHIAIGDLGPFFRMKWESFPAAVHLQADPELVAAMRAVMPEGKRVIGISWRSTNQEYGGHKTMHILEMVEPLIAAFPDAILVNLQYGDTAEETELVRALHGVEILDVPGVDLQQDLEAVGGLMMLCDQVVSVSNTHAHLAAALGRPTLICLPKQNARFWYWFMDREDSPWYPAAKLFRQRRHGFWGDVMDRVVETLKAAPDTGT